MFYDPTEVEEEAEENQEEWRTKQEVALCLIDVRYAMAQSVMPSGQTNIQFVFKCVENYLKSKIIAKADDKVALVVYGTKDLKNEFGLTHVQILREVSHLSADYIKYVQTCADDVAKLSYPESESHRAESVKHALWACSYLLQDFKKETVDMRIFVFTNDDDPCQGNEQQREQIFSRMQILKEFSVELQVYPLVECETVFKPDFWNMIVRESCQEDDADFLEKMRVTLTDKFEVVRRKIHRKRRVYATELNFFNTVSIHVEYYLLCRQQRRDLGTYLFIEDNKPVIKDLAHVCKETGEVLEDPPIKAWNVKGKNVVVSPAELANIKTIVPTGIHVLGFKPRTCLKPYQQVRSSGFLYPNEKEFPGSAKQFLSFQQKMIELDQIAICSFAASRTIGLDMVALVAQQELLDDFGNQVEPPGMHVIFLPFADDARHPELKHRDKNVHFATDEQKEAAKSMIAALDLEDFDSSDINNPSLQRHYDVLQCIALEEEPDIDQMEDNTLPDPLLFKGAANEIGAFQSLFRDMGAVTGKKRKANK